MRTDVKMVMDLKQLLIPMTSKRLASVAFQKHVHCVERYKNVYIYMIRGYHGMKVI